MNHFGHFRNSVASWKTTKNVTIV